MRLKKVYGVASGQCRLLWDPGRTSNQLSLSPEPAVKASTRTFRSERYMRASRRHHGSASEDTRRSSHL
ncbi:hypothetical protein FA95DRAFT_1566419 [Auriscalpium vulgare]|uniref:Uncharacterized protein n=1 Tax=Auriscalpium vulgare TaxID=40419 RepID=A0ACB8R8D9_9AGAM|nr:hypothetical protein FA95DRAFT_1566419 [Auriscalpium vulgare]